MKKILFALISIFLASCSSDDSSSIVQQEQDPLCVDVIAQDFEINDVSYKSASLDWVFPSNNYPLSFEAVYGETGFSIENGITITDIDCSCVTVEGLSSNTSYQLYVRGRCSDTEFSGYSLPREFTTNDCPTPTPNIVTLITTNSAEYHWGGYNTGLFEVEYGLHGFAIGTGIVDQTEDDKYTMTGLLSGTEYDIYVRSICGTNIGDFAEVKTFTTEYNCNKPYNLNAYNEWYHSIKILWSHNGENSWQIEYGLLGFEIGTGTIINTSEEPYQIYNLQNNTTYQIYVRAICSGGGFSENEGVVIITDW